MRIVVFIFGMIIFSVLFSVDLKAQSVKYDSSVVSVKYPDSLKIEFYKKLPEFVYDREVDRTLSWWDRFKIWLLNKFFSLFSNEGAAPYIRYALILIVSIYIIVLIIRADIQSLFFKSKSKKQINFDFETDDIYTINFDEQINNAIKNSDFRLAVRYSFLKSLRFLTDSGLIKWKPSKTNREYFTEMNKTKIAGDFKSIANIYEHIWYGHFLLTPDKYKDISVQFSTFINNIKSVNN